MRKNSKTKNNRQRGMNSKLKKPVKPIETKRLIITDLSKKSPKSKVKRKTYGRRSSGLFFDNLITVEELAVIFGLAPQTIRNWVAQGKLPYVKIGKRNLFLSRSVQEWLNRKEEPQWR